MTSPTNDGPTTGASTPTNRRRPLLVLVPLIGVVVVAIGGLAVLGPDPRPGESLESSRPAAFPPPPAPLVVSLERSAGGPAHVGYPERLTAAALGMGGVAGLELWVGGERLEVTTNTDVARPAATARWDWTPRELGDAVLVARAWDAAGRTTQSAPLRVTVVSGAPQVIQLTEEPALEGETLDAVAARLGVDPAAIRRYNAELPVGSLEARTVVVIPHTVSLAPPVTASRPRDLSDAVPVADVGPITAVGLATPALELTVDDCLVKATASGGGTGSQGYAFSALPPVGGTFVPLPPVAPGSDGSAATSFNGLAGLNLVTVSSYDANATAPSAIVPVVVPKDCNGGWEGDAQLDGGHLIVSGAADRAYLYVRVGDTAWERVPPAGGFVEPVDGVLDFGPYLPPIADMDLRIEAWGWVGGALGKLGAGQYTAPKVTFYSGGLAFSGDPLLGVGTNLDIVILKGYDPAAGPSGENESPEHLAKQSTVDRPGPTSTSAKKTFKWSTTVPGITHLVWQVLPYPLGTTSTTLTPPFLIDSDDIPVQGNTTGYFTLDLKPYLLGTSTESYSATQLGEQLVGNLIQADLYGAKPAPAPADVLVDTGGLYLPKPSGATSGGASSGPQIDALVDNLAAISQLALTALYVRVIPFVGGISVPNASNSVVFDIVEPSEPIYIDTSPPPPPPTYYDAYQMEAFFHAPTGSSMAYYQCAIVVESSLKPVDGFNYQLYQPGVKLCPNNDDDGWSIGDAFESFVSWVGDVWDFAVGAYGWVKDQVVNAVLLVVPCETVAKEVAKQNAADSKAVCKTIAKTALDAALATFGIPPEIPDWKGVMTAAKGDLRTFILENAKDIPGVSEACLAADAANSVSDFTTCEELIDDAIDIAVKQVAAQISDAAAKPLGLSPPPGVLLAPHPKSMPQPPHFTVKLTRTTAPLPSDVQCLLTASMTSQFGNGVNTWTWKEYEWDGGNPTTVSKGPAVVSGQPFMSAKQPIAPLAPGHSMTYEVWLSKPTVWFEPDGWNDYYAEQYAKWNGSYNHAWVLLVKGATVTGKISSNCAYGGENTQVLTGSAYN